jgi:hypothetical protein
MNRCHVLALAVLALAGAMLFPTMAAPSGDADTVADTDIVLEPYGGPNGAYAVMFDQDSDGEDELGLDFSDSNDAVEGDGVNAGSLTPVHRVFTITYTGDRDAKVYLTDGNDDITFYRGTDTTASIEGGSNAVVLGPNDPLVVGVLIDARDGDDVENVDAFTVHASDIDPETTTTTTTEDNSGGGGGGGDGDGDGDVSIQSVPESTPNDDTGDTDETDETDTPADDEETGTTDDTDATNETTADAGADGTTSTVTVEPVGTTLTTAETAADLAGDPGAGGSSGFGFAGLPWWLALLALVAALVVAGYGRYKLGA